ncbi:MAG: hypothetical protein PHF51_05195 [Candidatus ainarchaeum sp.]|nr:hypothetical protein [Candidatus ainarchaeum sp.]
MHKTQEKKGPFKTFFDKAGHGLDMEDLKHCTHEGDWKAAGLLGARTKSREVSEAAVKCLKEIGLKRNPGEAWAALHAIALRGKAYESAINALWAEGKKDLIRHVGKFGEPESAAHARKLHPEPTRSGRKKAEA